MKKQLLFAVLCALTLQTKSAMHPTTHKKHGKPSHVISLYHKTIMDLKKAVANANLSATQKTALVNALIAHFDGKMGLPNLKTTTQTIYNEVIHTYDSLKASDATSPRLGKQYAKATHFAQKAIGIIMYPGKGEGIRMGPGPVKTPRTVPVGPEKGKTHAK